MALKQEISTEPSLESTLERMSKAKVFKEDLKHQKNNVFGLSGSSSRHLRPIQDGKKCLTLIQKLKKKMNEQPFLFSAIADTKTINPMDITTVEKNLKTGVYLSPLDFAEDVRKILRSGMRSADNNPAALIRAQEISGYFEENFKEIENEIWNHAPKAQYRKSAKKSKVINFQQSAGKTAPAIRKTQKPTAAKSEMNISEDKQQFCEMIGRTPTENQRDAIQVVSDQASDSQNKSEVLEFGNAAISTDRMPELQSCVVPKFELVNNDQEEHENERNNIFDNSDPVQEVIILFLFQTLISRQVSNHAQFSISPKKITDVKSQSVNVRLDPTTNKNSNSDDSDSSFITGIDLYQTFLP